MNKHQLELQPSPEPASDFVERQRMFREMWNLQHPEAAADPENPKNAHRPEATDNQDPRAQQ